MCGERQVEPVGGKQVNLRPASERHQQPEEAADSQEYDRDHGIRLDQLFRGRMDLETRCGAGAKFCVFGHCSAPLLDYVKLADHQVVAGSAEFIAHDAVLPDPVGFDGHDHVVAWMHLQIDVHGLQRKTMLYVYG